MSQTRSNPPSWHLVTCSEDRTICVYPALSLHTQPALQARWGRGGEGEGDSVPVQAGGPPGRRHLCLPQGGNTRLREQVVRAQTFFVESLNCLLAK